MTSIDPLPKSRRRVAIHTVCAVTATACRTMRPGFTRIGTSELPVPHFRVDGLLSQTAGDALPGVERHGCALEAADLFRADCSPVSYPRLPIPTRVAIPDVIDPTIKHDALCGLMSRPEAR